MKTTDHFEFDSVRKLMADLLQTADRCRLERIAQIDRVMTGMRETLKRAEDTVRTCPAEIAKLEAEREALSKLTPEAAVREMLPPPPPAPNRFDCRECGQGVAADEDGCCATCGRDCAVFEDGKCVVPFPEEEEESNAAAIHRAHREALAQQSPPVSCTCAPGRITFLICDHCKDSLPDGLWTQATATPMETRRAAEAEIEAYLARNGSSVPTAPAAPQPAPPALLDLRTLPVGTACEAMGKIRCANGFTISPGELFTIDAQEPEKYTGPYPTRVRHSGKSTWVAENQSARVVKHACPRCDEGMREIEYVNRVWFSDAVRVEPGTRATIVEWFSARTGKTNMDRSFHVEQVRFVRADVPPPSEWCDGKGVG